MSLLLECPGILKLPLQLKEMQSVYATVPICLLIKHYNFFLVVKKKDGFYDSPDKWTFGR